MENQTENQPPQNFDPNAIFEQASTGRKFVLILAALCFGGIAMLTLNHLGFIFDGVSSNHEALLSKQMLWTINIGIGILGVILLAPKTIIPSIITGTITAIAITGSTILYLSLRENIYSLELIIPLLIGFFVGIKTYQITKKMTP